MRLHSRVYLHSLAVLLVVGVATSLVFALVNRGGGFREMGERVARHAAALAADGLRDPAVLARRVGELHETLDVDVAVRDLDGRPLAAAGEAVPLLPADAVAAVRAGRVVTHPRPPSAMAPVRDPVSGAIAATVQVSAQRRFGPPALLRPLLFVTIVLVVVAGRTGAGPTPAPWPRWRRTPDRAPAPSPTADADA